MEAAQSLYEYLAVAGALFAIGVVGVLTRRNALILFLCVELMLNAANVALVAFSRFMNDPDGAMLVFFVMVVAAAEAVVGLAILIAWFRLRQHVNAAEINLFRW